MVAYTKPQKGKGEESEGLRGEGDQIKFIDLKFERWLPGNIRTNQRNFYSLKTPFLFTFWSRLPGRTACTIFICS